MHIHIYMYIQIHIYVCVCLLHVYSAFQNEHWYIYIIYIFFNILISYTPHLLQLCIASCTASHKRPFFHGMRCMQFTLWHHALDHRQAIRKGGRFTAGHGALVTEPHQHGGGTLEEPNPGYSWMFSNKARTKMQDRSKTFQGSPQHFIQKAWSWGEWEFLEENNPG